MELDTDNPWSGILSAVVFGIRSTVHTTTQATPMQLVFGRDSILNIKHLANWRYITERKEKRIRSNNKRENTKLTKHEYKVNDKVLVKQAQASKYGTDPYKGPYTIVQVNDNNGTVKLQLNKLIDTYNIRNIHPYRE